jgi:hypothetical protein
MARRALSFGLAAALAFAGGARADTNANTLSDDECVELMRYRNGELYRQYEQAFKRYDLNNEARVDFEAKMREARQMLSDAGTEQQLRWAMFAKCVQGVSAATLHLIAALTPYGAVEETIADSSTKLSKGLKKFDELKQPADMIEDVVKFAVEKAVDRIKDPVGRTLANLALMVNDLRELKEVGELEEKRRQYIAQVLTNMNTIENLIHSAEANIEQASHDMSDVNHIKSLLDRRIRSGCPNGICFEFEAQIKQRNIDADKQKKDLNDQLDALKQRGPQTHPIDIEIMKIKLQAREQEAKLAVKIGQARKKVGDLMEEAARVLDELRRGLFCSKCHRSRSQIEAQTGQSFEAHLGQVQGHPEPAPPELIAQTEHEYAQKIAAARGELAEANAELARVQEQFKHDVASLEEQREKIVAEFKRQVEELEGRIVDVNKKLMATVAELKRKEDDCHRRHHM